MKLRHTAIPAVYALIHKWDGLLFMRRRNTGFMDGKLGLPSGHVEPGESLTQALAREVHEEIGVRLTESQFKLQHTRCCQAEDGLRLDFFFHVGAVKREEVKNAEPEKCSELVWVPPPYERDDIIPYVSQVLSAIDRQIAYSSEGAERSEKVEKEQVLIICW